MRSEVRILSGAFISYTTRFILMILRVFSCGPIATNSYLLACSDTKKAWIIDAPKDCFSLLSQAIESEGLHVEKIVLTHSHWDHIADLSLLKKGFGLEVLVHKEDVGNVERPGSDGLPLYFPIEPVSVDQMLSGGELLTLGHMAIKVIHTPGHSPGGICLYIEQSDTLISGDTLFQGSMGRVDLPTSNPSAMWKSLKLLSELPSRTQVYPGHGNRTSIQAESWMKRAEHLFS
ncbi:MAG: MBL fold metallo-hydrolase [Chlamydiae bacterium]|nr:MBL fold metallo-hydrolase [Chlamydiota bacterium]